MCAVAPGFQRDSRLDVSRDIAEADDVGIAGIGPSGEAASARPEKRGVVHVVGTITWGGVATLVRGMASSPALSAYRHSVICVFGIEDQLVEELQCVGIKAASCPFPWPNSLPIPSYTVSRWIRHRLELTFPWRLAGLLQRLKADLVHTHVTSRIDLQADGVLRRARLPWVWTIHGQYGPSGAELSRWRRAAELAGERRTCITADSGPLADDFVCRGLGRKDSVRVVHAGADVVRFRGDTSREQGWRSRRNIREDAVLFGSAGRFVREKAYEVFARAASLLVEGGANAHFVIAGDGRLRAELESEIARLGLERYFHLIGPETDMPFFLRQLDVFVLPSRSEGFPLALIEALASGLPCIATRVGGVPEMFGHNGGLIVPPESPAELAEAMRAMLSPATRESYGRRGPALAQQFSVDNCASEFADVYASLLT